MPSIEDPQPEPDYFTSSVQSHRTQLALYEKMREDLIEALKPHQSRINSEYIADVIATYDWFISRERRELQRAEVKKAEVEQRRSRLEEDAAAQRQQNLDGAQGSRGQAGQNGGGRRSKPYRMFYDGGRRLVVKEGLG